MPPVAGSIMFAVVGIGWWHWAAFIAVVLVLLGLDLRVFHVGFRAIGTREALLWTAFWVGLSLGFAVLLGPWQGEKASLEFVTGYLIELSLSMDNVFVIALIFAYFNIPAEHQHRVLFWGILGALVMRGLMIGLGVALIHWLHWTLYFLGAFVLYTGVKTMFLQTQVQPEDNRVLRLVRRFCVLTPTLDGQKLITQWQGRRALTPLAVVLVMVETTDLVFATDSVPAIFAVTTDPFIVFTSNVCAILGLRSLYSVLAHALRSFRYLKTGLSLVLVFVGAKMLLDPHGRPPRGPQVDIPIALSLLVVGVIFAGSMGLSFLAATRSPKPPSP